MEIASISIAYSNKMIFFDCLFYDTITNNNLNIFLEIVLSLSYQYLFYFNPFNFKNHLILHQKLSHASLHLKNLCSIHKTHQGKVSSIIDNKS